MPEEVLNGQRYWTVSVWSHRKTACCYYYYWWGSFARHSYGWLLVCMN